MYLAVLMHNKSRQKEDLFIVKTKKCLKNTTFIPLNQITGKTMNVLCLKPMHCNLKVTSVVLY